PGRALGREHLDALLLRQAAAAGATVFQPFALTAFVECEHGYNCTITAVDTHGDKKLRANLIIAAHGSWESGPLPTQDFRRAARPSDLLGFKAHFRDGALPAGLMPLLAFAGGYGGMVQTDGGRLSLSVCVRRDVLERCRKRWPGIKAGAAVLAHIRDSTQSVDAALRGATLDGTWLAAGPLRTGIRTFGVDGVFAVGNAAAEAHPVVAEGISMAIQSSALLCSELLARPAAQLDTARADGSLDSVRAAYAAAWRKNFSGRLRFAATYAHLFMRPLPTRIAIDILKHVPLLLTEGARWSGKSMPLRGAPHLDALRS
ncbi:MAG: FAD-dependent oxidoreductase, partial [Betaproteobacteria bacterium]